MAKEGHCWLRSVQAPSRVKSSIHNHVSNGENCAEAQCGPNDRLPENSTTAPTAAVGREQQFFRGRYRAHGGGSSRITNPLRNRH